MYACPDCIFPIAILRVLVAIADYPEDKLRLPCIETICEIAVLNPDLAYKCGAIKLLCSLLVEGPKDLVDALVWTLLFLLDHAQTRQYILPGAEVEVSTF